jgi:hypothetical protein
MAPLISRNTSQPSPSKQSKAELRAETERLIEQFKAKKAQD